MIRVDSSVGRFADLKIFYGRVPGVSLRSTPTLYAIGRFAGSDMFDYGYWLVNSITPDA